MIFNYRDKEHCRKMQGRILITGAAGFVGSHLMHGRPSTAVVGLVHRTLPVDDRTYFAVDLLSGEALDLIRLLQPRAIIHAAAFASLQMKDADKEQVRSMNADVPVRLAELAHEIGCRFIHLSTDMVFDGRTGNYTESDPPNPINFYGQCKLEAERGVAAVNADALIARLALVFGHPVQEGRGQSFLQWVMREVAQGNAVNLFTDEWRTPVYVVELAQVLHELADTAARGIIHLAGAEKLNRMQMGENICHAFALPADKLVPKTLAELGLENTRPADLSMDCTRLNDLLGRPALSGFSRALLYLNGKETSS